MSDEEAIRIATEYDKNYDLPEGWALDVRDLVETGDNEEILEWAPNGADARLLDKLVSATQKGRGKRTSGSARTRSPKSPKSKATMFSPPAKRARAAPEELMEKASGGPDTGDGTEVNVGATLKQLQADFSKFQRESADEKLASEGKVRELERRLAGAGKDPRAVTMPPPLMPPPPGVGAGKSDLATEIAELKAQLAELKGSPPPRQNAEPGALRDILVGLLDEDGKGLPNKADNEKKLDKEAMRRKLCTSIPYQLSELKKDRLGMRPEEAQTIQQLWDALRYRLDQEAEFHMDTEGRMAELTKVLRTAQEEAVQELAIISGPLRHHGAEQKAQVESLFVAKVHRRLRSEPSLAGA